MLPLVLTALAIAAGPSHPHSDVADGLYSSPANCVWPRMSCAVSA